VPAEASVAEPAPERSPLRWVARGAAILAAAAFIALLAYGIATKGTNTSIDDSLARDEAAPAPNFTLDVLQPGTGGDPRIAQAMADGKLSLRELRGSPVILNFWASWCIPCRDESPNLQSTWEAERGNGVIVLGLDQQDITGDARAFIKRFALTYPMVRDGGDSTAHRYGTTGIPETYFISPEGKVVGHVIGALTPVSARRFLQAAKAGEVRPAHPGGAQKKT
jgi:cytochrome c biogenesis protein CcmG, thiol:disulfide interchange protein DsbE